MGERIKYIERRNEAVKSKNEILSIISDGMAQNHCELPYQANVNSFGSDQLSQHLQGCLVHGKGIVVCRTFHNLKLGANAQIHSLLVTLEKIKNNSESRFHYCDVLHIFLFCKLL
jgi:hypothetical protein